MSGVDFGVAYQVPTQAIGRVIFSTDWSYMIQNYQLRAGAGGVLSRTEKLNVDGTTRWRGAGTVTWRRNQWNANLSAYYVGGFADSTATTTLAVYDGLGRPDTISRQFDNGGYLYRYRVSDVISYNAGLGYRFKRDAHALLRNTSVKLGVVNLTDKEPPLTPDTAGYSHAVHASLFPGRTWTIELARQF